MKKAVHLTMAPIENDARLRRILASVKANNFAVELISPGNGFDLAPMNFVRKGSLALRFGISGRLGSFAVESAFWSQKINRQAYGTLLKSNATIIHAHDWDALPICAAAGNKMDVPVIYDSHEFASEMHHERLGWRLFMSPAITRIERTNIRACAGVITVSEGIADALHTKFNLNRRPQVVRNIPAFQNLKLPKKDDDNILLHYHGILAKGRGLEIAIKALAQLPDHYRLRITGPTRQPNYQQKLKAQALSDGVLHRIEFHDSVEPSQLIEHAAQADIGLCVLPGDTIHIKHALPNKLFEYIAARLCCVVSNGPDMANIVSSHNLGVVLERADAVTLANAVQAIDIDRLNNFRDAAAKAATKLCWENEERKLLELYTMVCNSNSA